MSFNINLFAKSRFTLTDFKERGHIFCDTGGLLIGDSHEEGGLHTVAIIDDGIGDRFQELEGFEYLINPTAAKNMKLGLRK